MGEEEKWKMPAWMEPYREDFQNTDGFSVETLLNPASYVAGDRALVIIESAVAQVGLLMRLYDKGKLN